LRCRVTRLIVVLGVARAASDAKSTNFSPINLLIVAVREGGQRSAGEPDWDALWSWRPSRWLRLFLVFEAELELDPVLHDLAALYAGR
jgi:hypothetical protein